MSDDIRVLLIKLADRLHNMRTLHFIEKRQKQRRIALETMEIYAPLAERIGMKELKDELEDLSFAILNPDARFSITSRLNFLKEEGKGDIDLIVSELKETLSQQTINAEVYGREKLPYSIWKKAQRKKALLLKRPKLKTRQLEKKKLRVKTKIKQQKNLEMNLRKGEKES